MNMRIIILIALAAALFSIPAGAEIAEINETPGSGSSSGGGGGGTYPPAWCEMPAPTAVEIRGEVVDAATQIAPFTWTGQNFAGLYYDVDRNLMSDSLTSTVTVPGTIESGNLEYITYRVESCYKNPEIGEYFAIGWLGARYMAVNGKPYIVSPIIFEMDECDKKTLAAGDRWWLGNGYSLIVAWIDCNENKVRLSLVKDGVEVASSVIQPHETGDWFGNCMGISGSPGAYDVTMWNAPTTSTFVYQKYMGLESDVPIFSVYVDAIFRGTETDIVQLKYAVMIDDDPVSIIETGSGMMDAMAVTPESVRLVNRKNIDLRIDSDIDIAGDLRIRVADDRDGNGVTNYRYYPYVNRACQNPDPEPTPTPTPAPYPLEGVGEIRIRGEVVEPAGTQTGDIVWNASNAAFFWYDPDSDLTTETLRIVSGTLSDYDRTIEECRMEYTTETWSDDFDYRGWGEYDTMSFMTETYFAGYSANTANDLTDDTPSLVSNNILCKVLIDEDDEHCIFAGTSLKLQEGYELNLIQLDINGGLAQIELLRNGNSVDTDIIGNTETYVYTRDLGKVDDVPLIAIHIDSIIASTELDMIVIDGIFQISGDYISVKPGDNYGEMEIVNTSSDTIRMDNYDDIDLLEGDTVDLMGDIKLIVADNETFRFAPVAELTDPGTYEVRGAVHSQGASQSDAIVWNASNAAFFWYEIDSDVATETLEIAPDTLSGLDRTIENGNLVYATHPVYREYELHKNEGLTVDGHEEYLAEGFVGLRYVAINGRADKICELLSEFEDTDKKTLATGEPWNLGGGFTLTARQIDIGGDKVWFSLYKNGKELDSEIVSSGGVYTYTPDIGGAAAVPAFSCYADAIFVGTDSDIVQVMYVFLIDDYVVEIGTGDRFGCMEAVTVSSAEVILKNDGAVYLDSGTTIPIMDDLYFKTADDSVIRFYPFVERIIWDAVPPVVGDYIFDDELNVNEGIVIENSINIDVVGVGTGMGNYAKFRISSYQKPARTITIYKDDRLTRYDTQFGTSIYIDVTGVYRNDSVRFRVTGPNNWRVTEYYVVEQAEEPIPDTDGDGVPDVWDKEPDTHPGYRVNSDGIGRRWGDMNGDGKLTSVDALMIMQAAAGNLKDPVTGCGELDQRVLRMYDQTEDGLIDADWMDAASIDLELNRIRLIEYDQVKYAYEHQCPVELAE